MFDELPPDGRDRSACAVEMGSRSVGAPEGDGEGHHVITHHAVVTIGRPPDVVAAYVFDPTTMPHWSGVLYEIEPIDDIEPRLGRRMRANLKILGVCVTVEGELVDMDLRERWAVVRIVPAGGGGVIEHRLAVEPVESAEGVESVEGAGGVEGADQVDDGGGGSGSVLHFWNRVEVPGWLSATVSDELLARFLDHTATFALANIKDILDRHAEGDIHRLQRLARDRVPAPTPLQGARPSPS